MHILIIKTSSMGDLIHTLPALTDASKAHPEIRFDWVAEQGFVEIPTWHNHVQKVIPVAIRRWRKNIYQSWQQGDLKQFWQSLRESSYDLIIDAQGLIKSAAVAAIAKGPIAGFGFDSARENLAALLYQQRYKVDRKLHAVTRTRLLFAQALGYQLPEELDYGIDRTRLANSGLALTQPYLVFLHGTTWATKHWPENYWRELINLVTAKGVQILLPWGNEIELHRAQRLAEHSTHATILPKLSLSAMANIIAHAKACVSVDTGLSHLAAALGVPNISLYGPTNAALTGTVGNNQVHLSAQFGCAPCLQRECTYIQSASVQPACFATVTPQQVLTQLQFLLERS